MSESHLLQTYLSKVVPIMQEKYKYEGYTPGNEIAEVKIPDLENLSKGVYILKIDIGLK